MAKDPAFLFYSADFMIGTALFTHEQRGKYVTLLCYQHQLGHLAEQEIIDVCGSRDEKIFSKFVKDSEGKFYNTRLEEEKEKRQSFCQSRRDNASTSKASAKHKPKLMENDNEVKDLIKQDKGVKGKKGKGFVRDNPPTPLMIAEYCAERKNGIDPQSFFDSNTAVGWVDKNGNPYRDWKAVVRKWESWKSATAPIKPQVGPSKRPVAIVVIEKIAAGKTNHEIMHELIGTYSEHDINEALMSARGEKK